MDTEKRDLAPHQEPAELDPLPSKRELQFAPFSSQPSSRLRTVSVYLRFNAVGLLGLGITGAIGAIVAGDPSQALLTSGPVGAIILVGTSVALWVSGRDLAHRLRRGAVSAAAAFTVPLLYVASGAVPAETIAISVLGLGAIAVWSELD